MALSWASSLLRAAPSTWKRVALLVFLAAAVAVLAMLIQIARRDDSLAAIQKRGVLRVGYAVEASYAFLTNDGTVSGADPEIARKMADKLGIPRIEWRLADFGTLIDGLETHQFDVIAAGMFITNERERHVAFSLPTVRVRPGLLVEQGNPRHLHSYADLKNDPSIRVAVLSGSVEEAAMVRLGLPSERLVRVPDARSGYMAIHSGHANALALSLPTLQWLVHKGKVEGAEIATPFAKDAAEAGPEVQYVAFAFRKEDTALRKAWDRELQRFLGSPEHVKLIEPFGFSAADIPLHPRKGPSTPLP